MIIFCELMYFWYLMNQKFEETPSFKGKQVCEHRCQHYVHNH